MYAWENACDKVFCVQDVVVLLKRSAGFEVHGSRHDRLLMCKNSHSQTWCQAISNLTVEIYLRQSRPVQFQEEDLVKLSPQLVALDQVFFTRFQMWCSFFELCFSWIRLVVIDRWRKKDLSEIRWFSWCRTLISRNRESGMSGSYVNVDFRFLDDVPTSLETNRVESCVQRLRGCAVPSVRARDVMLTASSSVRSVLTTRQALGHGDLPMDIGALDANGKGKKKNKGQGKAKDKSDVEVTCHYCRKVGHRKADCWSWRRRRMRRRRRSVWGRNWLSWTSDRPRHLSERILSVEVAEIDETWTIRHEDWVMVDRGAGVSVCPVDHAPEWRIETSVNLVMMASVEGAAEEQDVGEKMDEELPVEERSARAVRKFGEPTPEERSAQEGTHLPRNGPLSGPFCSSRLIFLLKWELWMFLFREDAILASSISKVRKWVNPWIECDDFYLFTASTISTSLIHNIAFEGQLDQAHIWDLILLFQHENVEGVGNLSHWSSEICMIDQPCNSADFLLLLERKIPWSMVSLQISALEQSLDFVLHFNRQVSLYFLALVFRL